MIKKNLIVQELKRISKANKGILKPEAVVKTASNKNSPLHSCFDWNNTSAAQKYRIWQARQLISVSVEYSKGANCEYDVFVSLSKDRLNGNGYREVNQVLSNETLKQIMLNDALNEMNLFIAKYNKIKEIAQVIEVMQLATAKHTQKKGAKDYTINPSVV